MRSGARASIANCYYLSVCCWIGARDNTIDSRTNDFTVANDDRSKWAAPDIHAFCGQLDSLCHILFVIHGISSTTATARILAKTSLGLSSFWREVIVPKQTVIIDGDWGGDEMQLAAVLIAAPEAVDIAGATAVFGNTGHDQALQNAGDILHFLNATRTPFFPGEKSPGGGSPLKGDNAHGNNGLGGAHLVRTPSEPQSSRAPEFILRTLQNFKPGELTITATGPLSNIARAFEMDPVTMRRVGQILVMGGCTAKIKANDMPFRQGNITPDAEFNFYMAADDARIVMESSLPIVLFPMNCTHQLTFTNDRKILLSRMFEHKQLEAATIIQMISAPAKFDRSKFNSFPVMHDINTALYLLHPEQYQGRRGNVCVITTGAASGHSEFTPDNNGPLMVMHTIKDSDALFDYFLRSICKIFMPRSV
jgi:purine nucleosidase